MKIWLTKNSEVPVWEQLVTQITVAIASGELKPGDKLPSTRSLARRFGLHANTISYAYGKLAGAGLVELKRGSGIYITDQSTKCDPLDSLLARLFDDAAALGYRHVEVLARITSTSSEKVREFCLFEPNPDLYRIIASEIAHATGLPVSCVEEKDVGSAIPDDSRLVALYDEEERLSHLLGDGTCIFLRLNSVTASLVRHDRPGPSDLIVLVSGWDDFLNIGKLYLVAAGVDASSVVTVSTNRPEWKQVTKNATRILCDSVAAQHFNGDERVVVFSLVAPDSLEKLRSISR